MIRLTYEKRLADEKAENERMGKRIADSESRLNLTDDFLEILVAASRTYGWSADYTEVILFVEWCYKIAEKDVPDLEPIDYFEDG